MPCASRIKHTLSVSQFTMKYSSAAASSCDAAGSEIQRSLPAAGSGAIGDGMVDWVSRCVGVGVRATAQCTGLSCDVGTEHVSPGSVA